MSNTPIETIVSTVAAKETIKPINNDNSTDTNNHIDKYLENTPEVEKRKELDLRAILNPKQNYFFATPKKVERKLFYEPEVFNMPIIEGDNITTYTCLDTEYQFKESLVNSLEKMVTPDFKKAGDYISLFNSMKSEVKEVHEKLELSELLKYPSYHKSFLTSEEGIKFDKVKSNQDYKMSSPITLTIQIKNAMSEEKGHILINPKIEEYRQQIIEYWKETNTKYKEPIKYPLAKKPFALLDELELKGVTSSIERYNDYEVYKQETNKLPTHTITLITYFGVVDILKSFTCPQLQEDVKQLVREEKLTHDKRLKESNFKYKEGKSYTSNIKIYNSGSRLNWVITHNGIKYKVKINVIDLTALHGLTNLNELFINCGIENEYKKSLDNYKSCMFEALMLEPVLYHEYGLGDIRLFEAGKSYNYNLKSLYESLGLIDYFKETSLTVGSTVKDITQSFIFKKMNVSAAVRDLMTEKQMQEFFAHHTLLASPKYLQQYSPYDETNAHLFNANTYCYNRVLLSKTDGGRAYCNRILHSLKSENNSLCDIDISGAYTAKMSNQDFYIGTPVIDIRPAQNRISLRKHIKIFKKELGNDNYYMRVEGVLKYEQDLIVSFMDIGKGLKKHCVENDEGDIELNVKHNLENTKNKILTKEVEDGAITPDILDLILNELSARQRNDFLDNLYVKAFIYYPPSMKLSSPEEYTKKLNSHLIGAIDCTYKKELNHQDREILNPFHHYIKIPYSEYIDVIRAHRAKYKKAGNEAFNKMFKLVGNTVYGINVSKFFDTSNIIFANNITAGVRCCIWYAEKALNFVQTITDGGIFDLNKVPHPINKRFDTTAFVRAYQSSSRQLDRNDKFVLKPITRTKEPIIFNKEKQQWLVDEEYYDEEGFKNIVAELALEHIQKYFPRNRLMNAPTKHLSTKNVNINSKDINPEYEIKKGNFTWEVKDFISKVSFSGQTNYSYTSWKGEVKTKNRSYETKKNDDGTLMKPHTAFFLNKEGYLYLDEEFYKYISPSEMVLKAIELNPEAVPLLPPFALSTIIKTKDWLQSWEKTYKYSNLNFGDTSYKIVIKPLFEISAFKFQTNEQYVSWQKAHDKLKNKYGLTFELFFMNEGGTCNVKLMTETIDNMISGGCIAPIKILDPHNHLNRRMENTLKVYMECIKQAKRYHRNSVVGLHKYLYEHHNQKDYLENIVFEHEVDYYDTNKYSNIREFMHHDVQEI